MHFCFRKRVHHKVERPSVDGGCGAVHPHGALHAPVRAPDGELEWDGAEERADRPMFVHFHASLSRPVVSTFVASLRYHPHRG